MLKAPFKANGPGSNFIKICLQTPKGLPNIAVTQRHKNELKTPWKILSNVKKKENGKKKGKSNINPGEVHEKYEVLNRNLSELPAMFI